MLKVYPPAPFVLGIIVTLDIFSLGKNMDEIKACPIS